MFALDLFNNDHERRLTEGAVDRLEQRRIDDLAMKMDDLVARAKQATTPEVKSALVKEFQKCKAERDGYFKIKDECMGYGNLVGEENVNEGAMKEWLWKEAERLDLDAFVANAGEYGMSPEEAAEWWNSINGPLDEAGIGQDIANKTEKMARAAPSTPTGKVANTVKNAAKWLAGKGGPGKEGPTYEGAEDIVDRGEYDQEGDMAKDNLHTIRREAEQLERILGDNDNLPEWVQDKLANVKGMITAVSEYMQTQHERDREEATGDNSVTIAEWQKETPWKEIPKNKSGKPVDPRGEVTHLSDVARREAERKAQAQKKNPEEVDEAGGGWGLDPKTRLELKKRKERQKIIAKWAGRTVPPQDPKEKEINEGQRLHQGDPIVVTGPNEFEGKTGEIAEFSPSGSFVIVDLYNHGRHSMHLSDIAYNEYADREQDEEDDWYDDEEDTLEESDNQKLAAIVKNIQARIPKEAVKRPEIMQRIAQMVQQADPTVQDAMATAQQLVQQYGQGAPEPKATNVNDLKAQARSGNVMAQLPKTTDGLSYAQRHATFEGWQDFNKVEPYAVCLAGKPVKKFDYYEEARRFHDNWKQKLYREGDKAKADKITLMPLNLDEAVEDYAGTYSPEAIALGKRFCDHYNITDDGDIQLAVEIIDSYLNEFKATNTPIDLKKIKSGVADAFRQVYRGMGPGPTFRKKFQEQGVAEAQTDYQKRRQRERDVDAGKPVSRQPKNPQTDYAKKRAKDRKEMELGEQTLNEDNASEAAEQAIQRRILVAHKDLLVKFGPEKVMQAIEEVAYNIGDVDEIGSSDVSGWVNQVKQILGVE